MDRNLLQIFDDKNGNIFYSNIDMSGIMKKLGACGATYKVFNRGKA